MFRFYQRGQGQFEKWHPIPNRQAKDLGLRKVPMVTVLAISEISQAMSQSEIKYQGPLYFDIDHADIGVAITSAQTLASKLHDLGVVTPQIFLSGKKGLHILVNENVFSNGKPLAYLPYIYGEIADRLNVEGLDHSVYSAGKGRMWRQPNILRQDCATYKVPITLEELFELTPDGYKAYVSQPREALKLPVDKTPAADLMQLFMEAIKDTEESLAADSAFMFEPDERLIDFDLEETPPTCMTNLVEGIGVKMPNFNRAVMNFAGLMKVFGATPEVSKALADRLCSHNNYNSVTYDNEYKRENHARQILKRAEKDPNIGFRPSFLYSTIEQCNGCILCDGTLSDRDMNEGEAVSDNPIVEINGAYFLRSKKTDRRLSTFTLALESYSVLYDEDEDINLRDSVVASVQYQVNDEELVLRREFPEGVWNSNAAFKKAVEGMGNVVWHGSDNDLMLLKHYIFSKKETDMDEIYKTQKVGLRVETHEEGSKSLVYVEPSHSLNSYGERDTHKLTHNIPAPPRLLNEPDFDVNDKDSVATVMAMLQMNAPEKVGLMVGWFMACHIKPHLVTLTNQFPILNTWGNAGSGKTKTCSVLAYLHGCDFEGQDSPASLGGTTPWAAAEFVASSSSTPRLLDEFNRAKLEKGGRYHKIADLIKAAWGCQPHMRGSVYKTKSGGAEVESLHMSGPIAVMSEQQPDEPPLLQRSIQVNLNRKSRLGCEKAWETVYTQRRVLAQIGRHSVLNALTTPLGWVRERLDYWTTQIPSEQVLDSRPHYSFRVCLVGLDFLAKVLREELGFAEDSELLREISGKTDAVIQYIWGDVEVISREKAQTVSDRVIAMIAIVSGECGENDNHLYRIESGTHYLRHGNDLYIDMPLVFPAAMRYAHAVRQPLEITSLQMLKTLMKDEDYLVSTSITAKFCRRKVWQFDVSKLDEKGIDTTFFAEID